MAAVSALRQVRRRVRRPRRPPLPRPADRLPRLRPDARAGRRRTARRIRRRGAPWPARAGSWPAAGSLAVKGVGGYHLACDATNEDGGGRAAPAQAAGRQAVRGDGRATSTRPRRLAVVDADSEALLTGPRRPIVLLPRAATPAAVAAPRWPRATRDLGVMLAYTPLHTCCSGCPATRPGPEVLVMTSRQPRRGADRHRRRGRAASGSPRSPTAGCGTTGGSRCPATTRWCGSWTASRAARRRSRGYAPLPVALPFEARPPWRSGADLKNTCCLAEGRLRLAVSQHIGDMDDLATLRGLRPRPAHLRADHRVRPGVLAADRHPGYRSTALGPRARRDPPAARGAAPPRPHRLGDGRARPRGATTGDRHRLRRDRLRRRRCGLGRRGAGRRLQAATPGWRTWPT